MGILQSRLQKKEYKQWVKGGLCLSLVKEGLEDYADLKSKELHCDVLAEISKQGINIAGHSVCENSWISIRQTGLSTNCNHNFCKAFVDAIDRVGIDPTHGFKVKKHNLDNSDATIWHNSPWELAKLFMNAGQKPTQKNPQHTDLSGIINFIAHCKVAADGVLQIQYIDSVRKARNDIMHSSDMSLSSADFQQHTSSMIHLLEDPKVLHGYKSACTAVKHIKQVVNTDFEITLENEHKFIKDFLTGQQKATEVIQSEVFSLKTEISKTKKADHAEIQATRDLIQTRKEELNKIDESLSILRKKVAEDASLQKCIETSVRKLHKSVDQIRNDLQRIHFEFDRRLTDVEYRQSNTEKRIDDVEKGQASFQTKIEKQLILTGSSVITEEDEKELENYLKGLYTNYQLDVPVLPSCDSVPVQELFAPVIINKETETTPTTSGDPGKQHEWSRSQSTKKEEIKSFKNIFFDNNSALYTRVFLQGKAGSGKSTFCRYLVAAWCGDGSQGSAQYPDINVVKQFKYLFYLQSRFADKSESLIDMIFKQLNLKKSLRYVVNYVLDTKPDQCLVINDGLDEWKGAPSKKGKVGNDTPGLPSFEDLHNCVVLTTSRPWRIHALPKGLGRASKLLELQGIKDQKTIVQNILTLLEEPKAACWNFFEAVEDSHMSELTENPLLLIHALTIWRRNKSLSSSVTDNYCHILDIFIEQSKIEIGREGETYEHTDELYSLKSGWSKYKLPDCFQTTDHCKQYAGLLIQLGELAFQLLFREKHEQSLVFSHQEFPKSFDKRSLDICLKLGLLSQARAPGRGIEKMSNYSFPHKTFHEFMAALWLSISYSDKCRKFQECCKTLDDVFDFSVLIKFVCGLAPGDGAELVRYIGTEMEEEINKHRLKLDWGYRSPVRRLHELIIQCMGEARCFSGESGQLLYSRKAGQHQLSYYLPDVCIDEDSTKQVLTVADNQLRHHAPAIKSVFVEYHDDLCRHVVKCMKTMTSVLRIRLWSVDDSRPALSGLELPQQLRALRLEDWDIKDSAVSWPSCLSLLDLSRITLTHDVLQQLPTSLSHCPHLQELVLRGLYCRDHVDSCLPGLGLQALHRLERLTLRWLSVESLSLPGQQETHQGPRTYTTSGLHIDMMDVNMTPQGWRSWGDSLVHLSYQLTVELLGCNIDQDTRSYISSCPHFTVTEDDDDFFNFKTKLKATDTSS